MAMIHYKDRIPFQDRLEEAERIRSKFPGRVPIIVGPTKSAKDMPPLDKEKFLTPGDLTIAQFIFIIRRRMSLGQEQALFLFVNDTLPTTGTLMSELYSLYKSSDNFLYIEYCNENTFGARGGSTASPLSNPLQ